ncbi:hypothetical protein CYMTET_30139 [Cymbomonas tetramitiformis]|uniref:PRA1 family protein n=1 Tax=Cymbomonas tetramitiformis TaxID=36881 RepID=A0AAE0KUG9_9CHLO|nr:hypothetical protein CYMTET_30139 [Cymbomonas tetramitiformis]
MAEPGATTGGGAVGGAATSVAFTKLNETARYVFAQRRPWSELADRSAYGKPANFSEATGRVRKNINYFKVNYILFLCGTLILFLVTHPISMFLLLGLGASWVYLFVVRSETLVISGRTISDREQLWGMSAATVLLIFFLSSAGSVIFMGLGVGITGIVLHGAFRVPDDLFLDDNEGTGGFFSFMKPPVPGQSVI